MGLAMEGDLALVSVLVLDWELVVMMVQQWEEESVSESELGLVMGSVPVSETAMEAGWVKGSVLGWAQE